MPRKSKSARVRPSRTAVKTTPRRPLSKWLFWHNLIRFKNPTALVFLVLGSALLASIILQVATYQNQLGQADAYQVQPLPDDNLITNPWFRTVSTKTNRNGTLVTTAEPSLAGWTEGNPTHSYVTLSQKDSNPVPDAVVGSKCGSVPYCGTSAKISADDGNGIVGVDAYVYQIVAANSANTKLRFFTHWVTHGVDPFEVNIYGSNSPDPNGPWALVWAPVHQVEHENIQPPAGQNIPWLWEFFTARTPLAETILAQGYPYYKVEFRINLYTPGGFKWTGVYFTAVPEIVATPNPNATSTPQPTSNPTPLPTSTPPPVRSK